jgi:hypothetical protein
LPKFIAAKRGLKPRHMQAIFHFLIQYVFLVFECTDWIGLEYRLFFLLSISYLIFTLLHRNTIALFPSHPRHKRGRVGANILDTTVGYLLGETEDSDLFKDKKMLQRLQDITKLPEQERNSILLTLDHFIKASKFNLI